MRTTRANRALAPPRGSGTIAAYIQASRSTSSDSNDIQPAGLSLERAVLRKLRPQALRRLWNLVEHGGELPLDGSPGVLLPPLTARILGDELGCRPAQAATLLKELVQEGLMVSDGDRFRIPDPKALLAAEFS